MATMARKNISVFGIYDTRVSVDEAVNKLKSQGFRNSDVSVLMAQSTSTREFAHEKGTKAPEGAAAGAGTGALIGGALGWLAGIGALSIPVVGPLVAAGPIMALLAGVGVGGAVGGISGALLGLGVPEYEAKRYEGFVKDGGILLSVHADDAEWADKAEAILKGAGGREVSRTSEAKSDQKSDIENMSTPSTPNKNIAIG